MTEPSKMPMPLAPLHGLAPLLSKEIHTIILGSFPSRESLSNQQYYAHPRNQFWKLMSCVINENLTELPYPERLSRLLSHRIGLWDVITMCERIGSLDSRIRNPVANDFSRLRKMCPALETVCFNGKVAGAYASRLESAGYRTLQLPSSSPAYASRTFEEKLAVWKTMLETMPCP